MASLATFPHICFYCGRGESLHEGPDIEELQQQFAVVRPICTYCIANGKHPKTSDPKLIKKKN